MGRRHSLELRLRLGLGGELAAHDRVLGESAHPGRVSTTSNTHRAVHDRFAHSFGRSSLHPTTARLLVFASLDSSTPPCLSRSARAQRRLRSSRFGNSYRGSNIDEPVCVFSSGRRHCPKCLFLADDARVATSRDEPSPPSPPVPSRPTLPLNPHLDHLPSDPTTSRLLIEEPPASRSNTPPVPKSISSPCDSPCVLQCEEAEEVTLT